MPYNYSRFRASDYDLTDFPGPGVGEQMPDFDLTRPDGTPVRLSELWDKRLVLETGSVTCPIYSARVEAMKELIARHPETRFVVLYVREAHPGERVGPHDSETVKCQRAASLAEIAHETREVVVDDLAGTAHEALGGLPDMIYVMEPGGQIAFRADWNDPNVLESVLSGTADEETLRRGHFPMAKPSPVAAIKTLKIGGHRAVRDFLRGLPDLIRQHRRTDSSND